MKTKVIINIETPDKIDVYPEAGQIDEDFLGKEKQKKLKEFREQYVKDLHEDVVNKAKQYFENDDFEEQWIDDVEEVAIENYESFEEYNINIEVDSDKELVQTCFVDKNKK